MESLEQFEKNASSPAPSGTQQADPGPSRASRIGVWIFAIVAFFFFLILKLPEARIQNLIIAHLRIMAQDQGLLFSAEKAHVGLLLGPSLKLYNIELKSVEDERQTLKIPFLRIRPKLLSLLGSVKKAGISAEMLDGEVSGTIGGANNGLFVDVDLNSINLAATSLLKSYLPMEVTAKLDGSIKLDLDFQQTQKSDGRIQLRIQKLAAPPQNVYGFNLPKLSISETKIDISIARGQFVIRAFDIGKNKATDDLVGKIIGEGTLDRALERSQLNAKATFELSRNVTQSIPLLESLLSPARASDGKFVYRLIGPLTGIVAQPGG